MNGQLDEERSSPALPPLRIHHFLIWMAAVAAVMSGYAAMRSGNTGFSPKLALFLTAIVIPQIIALTTLAISGFWRFHRITIPTSVGHWLLVVTSFAYVGQWLVQLAFSIVWKVSTDPTLIHLSRFLQLLGPLTIGLIFCFCARERSDTGPWKRFCWTAAIGRFLELLLYGWSFVAMFVGSPTHPFASRPGQTSLLFWFAVVAQTSLALLAVALCLWAMRNDLVTHRFRHWTHWCGASTWVVIVTAFLGFSVHSYVFSW